MRHLEAEAERQVLRREVQVRGLRPRRFSYEGKKVLYSAQLTARRCDQDVQGDPGNRRGQSRTSDRELAPDGGGILHGGRNARESDFAKRRHDRSSRHAPRNGVPVASTCDMHHRGRGAGARHTGARLDAIEADRRIACRFGAALRPYTTGQRARGGRLIAAGYGMSHTMHDKAHAGRTRRICVDSNGPWRNRSSDAPDLTDRDASRPPDRTNPAMGIDRDTVETGFDERGRHTQFGHRASCDGFNRENLNWWSRQHVDSVDRGRRLGTSCASRRRAGP